MKCLRLSDEEREQVNALIGLIDEVTEELRRQEIFVYEGKEEQLKLELKCAEINSEMMKILRISYRSEEHDGEKENGMFKT